MGLDLKRCEVCRRHFTKTHIHHINGNHEDNRKSNLIVVCESCHSAIHWGITVKKVKGALRGNKGDRTYSFDKHHGVLIRINKLRKTWLENKYGKDIRDKDKDFTTRGVPLSFDIYPTKY